MPPKRKRQLSAEELQDNSHQKLEEIIATMKTNTVFQNPLGGSCCARGHYS